MLSSLNSLHQKVILITGGSRGIGRAIALKCAQSGAYVAIAAKTVEPHPKLEGTIHTVAEEIVALGGQALPLQMDIRHEAQIQQAVQDTVQRFGRIDILVNNASAIDLSPTSSLESKRLDLMLDINVRGTFLMSQACFPYLKQTENPHILTLSPPLNLKSQWFAPHCAYSMTKYAMSLYVLGMAEEFKKDGIGVNALWPMTTIATAAVNSIGGSKLMAASRKPSIVADAAYTILTRSGEKLFRKFFIDETVLREEGVENFDDYSVQPGNPLWRDIFIE